MIFIQTILTYVTFLIRLTVFLRKEKIHKPKNLLVTQKCTQLSKRAKYFMYHFSYNININISNKT